ncbi:kinase [Hirsutella rhossiliensis]|uniref:EKC/KEOPS complex subunit BUD32 n=1 Tax=Hirsutella rhossiliensis TaxID=111463 RepID=A0A9P8SJZ2_9HYPO|nr:kinase [Hirsutella rhossiliensis]KAH0964220.1 kinase [Hirsutella rhossiliensis]
MHIAQEVSRQAVGALAALHSRGICHGDLRPSNILLELQGLDGLSEEQDSHPTPEIPYAPKYLVYPPDFSNQPPPAAFGIPANYAAPEVVIDSLGNTAMDLWSLGCTLYEVRLGRRLFDVFQLAGLRKEDYVDEIACLLGEPPEPWAEYYESDDSSDTCTSPSNPASPENEDIYVEPQVQHARSIQEKLLISEAEAATLADLLEKLLRYRPEERLGAQDVLKHAWFHTQYR